MEELPMFANFRNRMSPTARSTNRGLIVSFIKQGADMTMLCRFFYEADRLPLEPQSNLPMNWGTNHTLISLTAADIVRYIFGLDGI
jgi:hypothetical protein